MTIQSNQRKTLLIMPAGFFIGFGVASLIFGPLRDHLPVSWAVIVVITAVLLVYALRAPVRRITLDDTELTLIRLSGRRVSVQRSAVRSMKWLWPTRAGPVAVLGANGERLMTLDDFQPGDVQRIASALGVTLDVEPGSPAATLASVQQKRFGWLLLAAAAIFLVVGGFALASYFSTAAAVSQYESAPSCSGTPGGQCRYSGDATILRKRSDANDSVDVGFASLGAGTYTVHLLAANHTTWESWTTGQTVPGELWKGAVTQLGGVTTADNPHNRGTDTLLIPLIFVALGAGAALTGVWFLRSARQLKPV